MTISMVAGEVKYDVTLATVEAKGILLTVADAEAAFTGRVAKRVRDTDGKSVIAATVAGLRLTKFQEANLARILQDMPVPNWRLGEALAECYLEDHCDCLFPWHSGRDMKNPDACSAGADLVGFKSGVNSAQFAFGEVKTSEDTRIPPQVMYGRNGMVAQLERLCGNYSRIDTLVRYLGFHRVGQSWEEKYKSAFMAYLNDPSDVVLLGVLVRTTDVNEGDLQSRAKKLARKNPRKVILLALYIPIPLSNWKSLVFPEKEGATS